MFKKVFISHAKEDLAYAEKLYDFLSINGYQPWLDKKKLLPGANWDFEIKKALKESDFVIILLSSVSVSKRGYFQREFKLALEYAEEKLVDDIYIVPILLGRCEVPESLKKYQWILADEEVSLVTVLGALAKQRIRYLETQSGIPSFEMQEVKLSFESKFDIDYTCSIPQFKNNKYFDSIQVNAEILQAATGMLYEYSGFLNEMYEGNITNPVKYFVEIGGSVNYVSPFSLSASISIDSFLGGAHPNIEFRTLNLSFLQGIRKLKFRDIVEYSSFKEFLENAIEKYSEYPETKDFILRSAAVQEENDFDFTFSEENLTLVFANGLPRMMVVAGFVDIPWSDLVRKIEI